MAESVRRLVAVMLTDIVGYSAITQRDEALALRLLEEHRRLVRPCLASHRGHEVKTIGDAFLVEFESALEAVECAIEIQRIFFDRNRKATGEQVDLRIGVHAGDVVHEQNDVYGDAINIVSRIEPLAEPGGICVTAPVFEQIRNKIHVRGTEIDSPVLKNIESPTVVYRLDLPWQKSPGRGVIPMVDRESELAALRRGLEEALRGKGRVVVLTGEAGVGKSRLAQEASAAAESHGFKALRSRALPGELSAPYFLWIDVANEYLRNAPAQLLYRVIGNSGAEIVKLVPELADRVGPTRSAVSTDPDEARIRFFDGVTQLFQSIAKESPLLVVFDDLQWADTASLRLLQYCARKLDGHRILLIATFRETDTDENAVLLDVLSDLNRERLVDTLAVKKLSLKDVEQMIDAIVGGEHLPPDFGRLVFEKTGGNPFFVEEVLQSLVEEGQLTETRPGGKSPLPGDLRLPDTVRRVIRRRLSRIDAPTMNVLNVASVLGYDFSYELLQQVSEIEEGDLLKSLESAIERRIIEEGRHSAREVVYSFTDRQVHDLLYDEQSAIRRRKFHLKAAHALLTLAGSPTLAGAHELAFHFLEGNDLEHALQYSLLAADRAEAVYAREDTIRHLRLALEILEARPNDPLRASLAERLSRAEHHSGEIESCLRHIEEAAALYEKLGDRPALARAHLTAGTLYANAYYDDQAAVERFERARRVLEGLPENAELGRVYLQLAAYSDHGLPSRDSRARVLHALDIGTRLGDNSLAVDARFRLLWSTPLDEWDSVPRQIAELEKVIHTPRPDPSSIRSLVSTGGWSSFLLEEDAPKALATFQEGVVQLRELGDELDARDVQGQDLALAHLILGHLETGERLAQETYEFAVRNYPTPDLPNLVVLAEVARMRGDLEKSGSLLEGPYERTRLRNSVVMRLAPAIVLARLSVDRGRPEEAGRFAREALAPFLDQGMPAPVIAAADYAELLAVAFEAASIDGTPEGSQQYLEELRRVAGILPRRPVRGFLLGVEGLAAARSGDFRTAISRYDEAAEIWAALGWTPNLGRILGNLADVLSDAGESSRAQATRAQAIETMRQIGATGEASRLAKGRARTSARERKARPGSAEATP